MRDTEQSSELRDGDVVLGDDWVIPQDPESAELRARRSRRTLFTLRNSPLARKIITFNLIALVILVAGLLYLDDTRKERVQQTARDQTVHGTGRSIRATRRPHMESAIRG